MGKRVSTYDFNRPNKFSKEKIRIIAIIHDAFARMLTKSLSIQLRSIVQVHVASVDQLAYEEFIRSVQTPSTLAVINIEPVNGNALIELDPALTFFIVDRLFGGSGKGTKGQHELTDIEQKLMEGIIVKILGNMREAWSQVIDLRPRLDKIETNPQFVQIVPPADSVVLIAMETKIGDTKGMINICIPYLTMKPIMGKISTRF